MDTELNVDAGLRTEFIDESLEMLSGIENLFVTLEQDPENLDTVQAIFRPIHSIKGNSSFFDFPNVKTLSHEMENVLDLVRKKNLRVTPELIGAELAGVDLLKDMLERGRAGDEEVRDRSAFEALVDRVKQVGAQELTVEALGRTVIDRLMGVREACVAAAPETSGILDTLLDELRQLCSSSEASGVPEPAGSAPQALIRLNELLHMPIDDTMPDELAREAGDCLSSLRALAASDNDRAQVDELLDNYSTFMGALGFDGLLQEMLRDGLAKIHFEVSEPAETLPEDSAAPTGSMEESGAPLDKPATSAREDVAKTMRVSEQHVDTFLSYVGELLVVRDMFNHLETRLAGQPRQQQLRSDFRRINETFAVLSDELQKSIMSIRRVAVGTIMRRVPRLVRDVASMGGKEINVNLEGESIEVDKSLIDLLEAPLTHMVRNAADHGIESPDARQAAGKPREGSIVVSVVEMPNNLTLTIRDDGAGLDYEKIQKKAVELGIATEGQPLSEEEVIDFLFQSGVSTAAEVTDVSGRGVGMDVVKRMVEEAGGSIRVSSQAGAGTTFEVSMPKSVTTQIVSGFLVESGQQRFVFPMTKVLETTRLDFENVLTVSERGRCFKHHDHVIPLISMHRLLELQPVDGNSRDFELVVTLASRLGNFGVSVDQVVGVQQVVLRQIEGLACRSESIAGGALMGDGSVALIIDVDRLREEYAASV